MPRRRSGRNSTRNRTAAHDAYEYSRAHVDPSYYLGYCMDEETPEAIMKKFEALERIQTEKKKKAVEEAAKKPSKSKKAEVDSDEEEAAAALTTEEMNKLFKETSQFTVSSALSNNTCLYDDELMFQEGVGIVEMEKDWAEVFDEYGHEDMDPVSSDYNDSLDEEEDVSLIPRLRAEKKNRKRSGRQSGGRRGGGGPASRPGSVNKYGLLADDSIGAVEVKYNPDQVLYLRIPNHPLPWSLSRRIRTLEELSPPDAGTLIEHDPFAEDLPEIVHKHHPNKDYTAVYVSPPWCAWDKGWPDRFTMADFLKLNTLGKIMPSKGICFIWVPKHLTIEVSKHFETMGFYWVESAIYGFKTNANKLKMRRSPYMNVSKENLVLFRRKGKPGQRLQILHQRTSDVLLGIGNIRPDQYACEMIETMLPTETVFLHLWAGDDKGAAEARDKWVRVMVPSGSLEDEKLPE